MKQIILIIIVLCSFALGGKAQVSVGLRDSRYACIGYILKDCYNFRVEHSLYSSKIGYQYVRCYLGYRTVLKNFFLKTDCYFGTTYNRTYQNLGFWAESNYSVVKWLRINVTLNPHYDTYFGFRLCTEEKIEFNVFKDIDFLISHSSIPEYRQSEQRLKTGLNFHVIDCLWVKPVLSFPLTGEMKNFRVLMSFGYTFRKL